MLSNARRVHQRALSEAVKIDLGLVLSRVLLAIRGYNRM
jgi:hypothetical protein